MTRWRVLGRTVLAWMLTASVAHADVRINVNGGRISVVAEGATLAEIFTEWARSGATAFVHLDRLAPVPVSLTVEGTEIEALETLLKDARGYVATHRRDAAAGQSRFSRVVIMEDPGRRVAALEPPTAIVPPVPDVVATPLAPPPSTPRLVPDAPLAPPLAAPDPAAATPPRRAFSLVPRAIARRPAARAPEEAPAVAAPAEAAAPSHLPSAPAGLASPVPGLVVAPPAAKARPAPGR